MILPFIFAGIIVVGFLIWYFTNYRQILAFRIETTARIFKLSKDPDVIGKFIMKNMSSLDKATVDVLIKRMEELIEKE